MPPAALFLVPARNREKNRAKGVPPLRFSHARGKQCKIERSTATLECGLGPTGSALAAVDAHPVSFPRSGCRRRRDGRGVLVGLTRNGAETNP